MSQVHLNRAGQNLGSFTLEDVQKGLDAGRFIGSDLGWQSGMENWKPLSTWPELVIPVETATPPPLIPPLLAAVINPEDVLRDGPPWEKRSTIGYLQAIGLTAKEALTNPDGCFSRMKQEGGLVAPLFYFIITGFIGGIFGVAYQLISSRMGMTDVSQMPPALRPFFLQQDFSIASVVGMVVGVVFFAPLLLALISFLFSAVLHLGLMMFGGANKPFEVTYRVFCYAWGSSRLLGIMPFCGDLIGLVWGMISLSIGLAKTHETDTWRAVVAVLLPLLVCCAAIIALVVFLISMVSGAAHSWR